MAVLSQFFFFIKSLTKLYDFGFKYLLLAFTSCLCHFCKYDHPSDKFIVTLGLQRMGTTLTWLSTLLCLYPTPLPLAGARPGALCALSTSPLCCVHMLFVLPRVQHAHHFPLSSSYSAFGVVCSRLHSYPVGSLLSASLRGSKVIIKCYYRSILFSFTVGSLCNFPFICEFD